MCRHGLGTQRSSMIHIDDVIGRVMSTLKLYSASGVTMGDIVY
jgi:hypothetical protein